MPGSLKIIPKNLFYGHSSSAEMWSLQNLTLNEGIEKIGEQAFYNCMQMTNLYLPSTITEISSSAFNFRGINNCSNIVYAGTINDWNNINLADDWIDGIDQCSYTIHCTDGDITK